MGMKASSDREILKKMCWLERHSRHISHTAITSDSTTAVKLKVIASIVGSANYFGMLLLVGDLIGSSDPLRHSPKEST